MEDLISELFSGIEIDKRKELFSLMQDWHKTVSSSEIFSNEENKNINCGDIFSYDGFFPGYYGTRPKVLFIAREPRDRGDNTKNAIDTFKRENMNQRALIFWGRILRMFNIIQNNGMIDENISADEIVKPMNDINNYGFAVMNISKYESRIGAIKDKILINQFFKDSKFDKRNFIREELELLDPDIIITANIFDGTIKNENMDRYFGKPVPLNENVVVDSKCVATLNTIKIKDKNVKLIDTYHFSSRFNDMEYFYKPISILYEKMLYN